MGYIVNRIEKKVFAEEWLSKTRIFAQSITKIIQDGMEHKRPDLIRKVIHDLKKIEGVKNLQVIKHNGKEAFQDLETFNKVKEKFKLPPEIINAYKNIAVEQAAIINDETALIVFREEKEKEYFGYDENGEIFYNYYWPIFNKRLCQKCHGSDENLRGVLKISLFEKNFSEHVNSHIYILAGFLSLAIIILVCTIYWIFNKLVSNPLNSVVKTIKDVERGNMKERSQLNSQDEIGFMATHFNMMLDRLEQERHLASIGRLSSVLAHEIKSPLGGISGAIQVIDEETSSEDPKKEILVEVIKEIGRLDKMVKELLLFSKPVDLSPELYNINKLINDTIKLLQFQCEKNNISISDNLDSNISDTRFDVDKLRQVFLNIFTNAIESMENGGTLTIESSIDIPPAYNQKGGMAISEYKYIRVDVSDTGKGIPSEKMQNIFTPFFTTKKKGSGLGLPISLRIVEKHGGMLKVHTEEDKGSKFSILLPHEQKEI